ncbi:nucleoid-associated protein [Marinobacter sp.]|uniref:nucleoid-associated protein n=1 Tax=Marinobacter sp. TaxID=50741 RepID=UPI0035C75783
MDIKNIIVHEVDKHKSETSGDMVVGYDIRKKENPINDHSKMLVNQVSKLFRNTGLSSGNFKTPIDENDEKPDFEKLLEKQFSENKFHDFVEFTSVATRNFGRLLNKAPNAKGGYLWFNHYVYDGKHFLSIVLLRKKEGLRIKNLSLDPVEEIDLDKLHMAARINISNWLEKSLLETRYISFRVGRTTGNVTDYFADFIGCQEYTEAKEDTSNLIAVTVEYCHHHAFDPCKIERAKDEVFERCRKWIDDGKPVYIEDISLVLDKTFSIDDEQAGVFLRVAQKDPYNLNNEIKIDKKTLSGLVRYRGHNKKMNISFDSELLDEVVFFNKEKGYLEFRELPEKLLAQLKNRELEDGGENEDGND